MPEKRKVHIDVNENVVVEPVMSRPPVKERSNPAGVHLPTTAQDCLTLALSQSLQTEDGQPSQRVQSLTLFDQAMFLAESEEAGDFDFANCCFSSAEICLENGDTERAVRYAEKAVDNCCSRLFGRSKVVSGAELGERAALSPALTEEPSEDISPTEKELTVLSRACWICLRHRCDSEDPNQTASLDAVVGSWYGKSVNFLSPRTTLVFAIFLCLSNKEDEGARILEVVQSTPSEASLDRLYCFLLRATISWSRGYSQHSQELVHFVERELFMRSAEMGERHVLEVLHLDSLTALIQFSMETSSASCCGDSYESLGRLSRVLQRVDSEYRRVLRARAGQLGDEESNLREGTDSRMVSRMFSLIAKIYRLCLVVAREACSSFRLTSSHPRLRAISLALEATGTFLNTSVPYLLETDVRDLMMESLMAESVLLLNTCETEQNSGELISSTKRLQAGLAGSGKPSSEAFAQLGDLMTACRDLHQGRASDGEGEIFSTPVILSQYTRALQIDPLCLAALVGAARTYEHPDINEPEMGFEHWFTASQVEHSHKAPVPYTSFLLL